MFIVGPNSVSISYPRCPLLSPLPLFSAWQLGQTSKLLPALTTTSTAASVDCSLFFYLYDVIWAAGESELHSHFLCHCLSIWIVPSTCRFQGLFVELILNKCNILLHPYNSPLKTSWLSNEVTFLKPPSSVIQQQVQIWMFSCRMGHVRPHLMLMSFVPLVGIWNEGCKALFTEVDSFAGDIL